VVAVSGLRLEDSAGTMPPKYQAITKPTATTTAAKVIIETDGITNIFGASQLLEGKLSTMCAINNPFILLNNSTSQGKSPRTTRIEKEASRKGKIQSLL
jgi:hypothetical protein